MSEEREALEAIVAAELALPVRPAVDWLASELARRHGETVLGVLFYGSCLRQTTDEGVLDFWLVVDEYGGAYRSPLLAWINPVAPPNVFYLERDFEGRTLRTKYGVISRRAFDQGTSFRAFHPYVFARFAQPARLLACRDDEARSYFIGCVARSIVVLVGRLVYLLPRRGGFLRFSLAAFWQEAFRRSYDSERRPEADETIRGLYLANAERYDEVGLRSLRELARDGRVGSLTEHPRSVALQIPAAPVLAGRLRWQAMRLIGRSLGLVRLFKTAYTFGDWVPYVLWKLERHTGRAIELSERQRRHPFVFGWPIILKQVLRRNLR
ncbi:hypothetical protein K2X89_06915 [Myxococcota bacterium]|nr:hypothetical protein [Myxococcota bacterium]